MEKKVAQIICTGETLARVSSDEVYRDAMKRNAMTMGDYNEFIFTPEVADDTTSSDTEHKNPLFVEEMGDYNELTFNPSEGDDTTSSDTEHKKPLWLEPATKYLISRMKELRPKVGTTGALKNKKTMWRKIAYELIEQGHNLNAQQVEAKFFVLKRQYKKTAILNSKTGRNKFCSFQNELDELFKEHELINPEHTLSSKISVEIVHPSEVELPASSGKNQSDDVSPPDTERQCCSKKRRSAIEVFLEKAEKRAARREESDNILRKKFLESLRKREEREEEKMKLLRKLVGKK